VNTFTHANKNLKTKLHHEFHDKSLIGEFVNTNKEMEKKPLTGGVTYEDIVALEKLKNDMFLDEVTCQRRRTQNKKVEKAYKTEMERKRGLFTGLQHKKN